jgi:hypothetical protein
MINNIENKYLNGTRGYTNAILEMMDEGILDPKELVQSLLLELSEREVRLFAMRELYDVFNQEEQEDEA